MRTGMDLKGVIKLVPKSWIEMEIVAGRSCGEPIKEHCRRDMIRVGPDMEQHSASGLDN